MPQCPTVKISIKNGELPCPKAQPKRKKTLSIRPREKVFTPVGATCKGYFSKDPILGSLYNTNFDYKNPREKYSCD